MNQNSFAHTLGNKYGQRRGQKTATADARLAIYLLFNLCLNQISTCSSFFSNLLLLHEMADFTETIFRTKTLANLGYWCFSQIFSNFVKIKYVFRSLRYSSAIDNDIFSLEVLFILKKSSWKGELSDRFWFNPKKKYCTKTILKQFSNFSSKENFYFINYQYIWCFLVFTVKSVIDYYQNILLKNY